MRIFVSAVSSEFRKARDTVAADLRARGNTVRVQSDFPQEADADTLLRKLHDYIRDCDAVVCIVGKRSGACPTEKEAAPFGHILPAGISEASYTQWEFHIARHFDRRLSVHLASDRYTPDDAKPAGADFPDLQLAFVAHLKAEGIDRSGFTTIPELSAAVLREVWDPGSKPIALLYPSLRDLFKGRRGFLRRLHESLTRAGAGGTAITSHSLYGMGGIGKTRAAVEYAWRYGGDYSALLFVQADAPEALRRNLAELTGTLGLASLATADDEARLRGVLDWLRDHPGWLLILDNVDTPEAMGAAERLMGRLSGGHVLLTSRLHDFASYVEPLELDVLAPDDAVAFLLERARRRRQAPDDEAQARAVAEELDRLALALEQAGATIDRRQCSFADYRALWRDSRGKVLGWLKPELRDYPRAVAETWQTSVAQLTEAGRALLERLAWLAPDPVPEFLLEVPIAGVDGDQGEALLDLAAYSLVTRDVEKQQFSVHRLVQDATRRSLDAVSVGRRLIEVLNWVDNAVTGDPGDVRSWPRLDPLASHVREVAERADATGIAEPTARLMNELGRLFLNKALHAQAEPLLRRALAIYETSLGKDHPNVAACLNNLAELLRDTDRLAEAEPLYRRALAITEASLGKEHPNVATCLNNLAGLLQHTNRLAEAEPLYHRALAITEASLGKEHPNVAIRLNNLAGLLRDTDRLAEAEPLYRRALAITEASLGKEHPTVAVCLNNLALLLQATDRLAEAEPLMRRALAIDEASLGEGHPSVARDLNNLAGLLQDTNRLAEAGPLMRRAVMIRLDFERTTGHRHPNRDAAFRNYAGLLTAMGKSEAEIRAALAALTGTT